MSNGEKVKLPREVAEALDNSKYIGSVAIMTHLARYGDPIAMQTTPELSLIHKYYKENPYLIASALINGYEVEQTPEDKVRELYQRPDHNFAHPESYRKGIKAALDTLNIKISGVNDFEF